MVVKNEFWLVKSSILRVKRHKTCKIGFKNRKPVKSVKPSQTCIKSSQLIKNIKTGPSSRFLLKWKTMWTALSAFPCQHIHSPFLLYPFPFPPIQICKNPKSPAAKQIKKSDWEVRNLFHFPLTSSAFDFTCFDSPLSRMFLARRR